MLALQPQRATPEQLPIISSRATGVEILRGAAGSGKTTTAILRLESLAFTFSERIQRLKLGRPVKILVLTYYRSLAGYVEELARTQLRSAPGIEVQVSTFASWARLGLGNVPILNGDTQRNWALHFCRGIPLPSEFLLNEIDYVRGRFSRENLEHYVDADRTGRGSTPQVLRTLRPQIIAAIQQYEKHLLDNGKGCHDWHTLAHDMKNMDSLQYDIVIVDEAQDFSANQLRAVIKHLAEPHCLTLVIDTAQRLYPRGYTWSEIGIRNARYHRLEENHRNTVEIASFAAGIIDGIPLDDDATLPNIAALSRHGDKPLVLRGFYSDQLAFALRWVQDHVDLEKESVAFLKPMGGNWFRDVRTALAERGIDFIELTQNREWPQGKENVALCTMHSAKGLEFDHVIMLGLNAENLPHGEGSDDDTLLSKRRLLAMAAARARKTVMVGYKPDRASDLIEFFKPGTFKTLDV
ncbi:3'-5' exonuclease [Azospirillum sp. SYSU D00513]|uniref:3'-5' exonuclease n=1 Tax=Azospirillum sp. SYSU D00513 TaxID=2812561 RepID=UPI001A97CA2D|nr:3'-5' exonuclease [Azospirillum sp. SYSU D00513]